MAHDHDEPETDAPGPSHYHGPSDVTLRIWSVNRALQFMQHQMDPRREAKEATDDLIKTAETIFAYVRGKPNANPGG